MTKKLAPYKHSDGSGCWTKNCSRGHLGKSAKTSEDKQAFIKEWFKPAISVEPHQSTSLHAIASPEDFAAAVASGAITRARHPKLPYSIYKYSNATVWKKEWNDVTMASRGLVVNDETNEIVARPFSKFFNYNEVSAPAHLMKGRISVTEKLDGSLGIGFNSPDGFQITTAGGFQSTQGAHATKLYNDRYNGKWEPRPDVTYMWEIIYPENRIAVNYGEEDDIHMIGAVSIKTGKSIPLNEITEWNWKKATEHNDFNDLKSVTSSEDRANHEGYIVHYLDSDTRVKFKHEEYLRHHRISTGVNSRRVWEILKNGENVKEWLKDIPEEFEEYVNAKKVVLQAEFDRRMQAKRAEYDAFAKTLPEDITPRDFATEVQKQIPHIKGFAFRWHRGEEITESGSQSVWDEFKPDVNSSSSFWNMNDEE